MFKNLKPDFYVDSVYDLPVDFFIERNITTLFVDLDNTLVGDEDRVRTKQFEEWFHKIDAAHIELVVVSNNRHRSRVDEFIGDMNIEWYHFARKQNGKLFTRLLQEKKLEPKQVAVIGDRITTDIVGGNKVGAVTILTNPITPDKTLAVKFMRWIESGFTPDKLEK